MEPGAVALEKSADRAFGIGGLEQLHVPFTHAEQHSVDAELLDGLAVLEGHAQPVAVELQRGIQVGHRDSDVVHPLEHGAECTRGPVLAR